MLEWFTHGSAVETGSVGDFDARAQKARAAMAAMTAAPKAVKLVAPSRPLQASAQPIVFLSAAVTT